MIHSINTRQDMDERPPSTTSTICLSMTSWSPYNTVQVVMCDSVTKNRFAYSLPKQESHDPNQFGMGSFRCNVQNIRKGNAMRHDALHRISVKQMEKMREATIAAREWLVKW